MLGLTAAAFVAGFISSIAGAGGMIVLPCLLWAGVPPVQALATNKCQSVFGTLSSALNYLRKGHLQLGALRWALLYALVGAVAGTLWVQQIDAARLETLLPYVLILLAVYFALSPRIADADTPPRLPAAVFDPLVGGGLGLYGGAFGPGMGSFSAAAFAGLRGFNMRKATAATKPLVLVANVSSLVIFIAGGHVVWGLALGMSVAQFVGARLGSNLVIARGAALVKPVIVLTTLAIALRLVLKNL
ncbi:MAG: hypothetical protein DWQ11_06015 [Proteobacteria bacterium]|nr:MAG: hypothetical protein DWQ11_06015 [Pseudomonadota bacterium]